jgi:hypothetical protein
MMDKYRLIGTHTNAHINEREKFIKFDRDRLAGWLVGRKTDR